MEGPAGLRAGLAALSRTTGGEARSPARLAALLLSARPIIPMESSARLTRADALLAVWAVIGMAALIGLLPRQHPDTAASFALTAAGAEARADAVLQAAGYSTEHLSRRAVFDGSEALMDSLQHALGHAGATAALRARPGRLPAFRWRVAYTRPRRPGQPAFIQAPFTVELGPDGRVWRLENAAGAVPETLGDRAAAARRLAPSDASPLAVPDAVRLDALTFGVPEGGMELGAAWQGRLAADRVQLALPGSRGLSAAAAAAFALRALDGTGYDPLQMRPVRVDPVPERGTGTARVYLEAAERVWHQRVAVAVEVTATGEVLALDPLFNPSPGALEAKREPPREDPTPEDDRRGRASVTWDVDMPWTSVFALGAWVVLAVGFLVLFVRRLSAQALDLRAALADAVLVGLAVSVYPVLLLPLMRQAYPFEGAQLVLAITLGTLFWIAGAGLMALVASGVSDSLMRARRREKLDAIALLRQGRLLHRAVGASLLRGALAALALLGLAAVLWALLPLRTTYGDAGLGAYQLALSPAVLVVTQAFWYQSVVGLALFVGVGAMLLQAFPRAVAPGGPVRLALVLLGLGVGAALLRLGPGQAASEPAWAVWAYGFAYGAAVGLVLWRYDALATLTAFVLAEAAWTLAPMLWAERAPLAVDAAAVLALVPLVGLAGVVAMRRAPRRADLRRYVPAYITELAERERLQREVEIAREVQRSFLPATMPDVPGLDLAAVCLPAEEVGGDYYDAFTLPSPDGGPPRLAVVVGDVSGKGIQAAFYMTLVKGVLRTLAPSGLGPAAVLVRLNEVFTENARPGAFVSAIYGVIDPAARTFTYARAGHNPLLVRRAGRARPVDVEARRPAGLAVGLTGGEAFARTLREDTVHLRPGDALVLYTDGFSEAMDAGRALFTDARLARLFAEASDPSAAALVGHAVADVRAFASADANPDDMTMLVARLLDSA